MTENPNKDSENVPPVLRRLQEHWWADMDDDCLDIPLTGVNQLNILGEAPIHIAAWKGTAPDVQWLLENGADINQIGEFGMTPLHYAYMGRRAKIIELLLKAGANENALCDRGLRPQEGYTVEFGEEGSTDESHDA